MAKTKTRDGELTPPAARRFTNDYALLETVSARLKTVFETVETGVAVPVVDLEVPDKDAVALKEAAARIFAQLWTEDGDRRAQPWIDARNHPDANPAGVSVLFELAQMWLNLVRQAGSSGVGRKPLFDLDISDVKKVFLRFAAHIPD